MTSRRPLPIFTPTAADPEDLEARTVGREPVISRLVGRVADAATSRARAHTLVVGPRGSGKTHLLALVAHRVRQRDDLRGQVVISWIPEDALGITSYADLLVELIVNLEGAGPEGRQRAINLRRARDAVALEELLTELAESRVIVAIVENLDRVFQGLRREGQHALRARIESGGDILLLAGTPLLFKGIRSRDEPWYGALTTERLDDLTLAEGTELLRALAAGRGDDELVDFLASRRGQARLEAIEHLAGGSPRLWMVLDGCATVAVLDEMVPAIEGMLDDLAPYFQQRLWELSPTEQKLVVELALAPGRSSVADLAGAVGLDERVAATTLRRLAESRWVRGEKLSGTDQRTTWYSIREPLLRHHLQFRDTTGGPLRMIVDFLRAWFDNDERRAHLATAEPMSLVERYLVTSLHEHRAQLDIDYLGDSRQNLLAEARRWIIAPDRDDPPDAAVGLIIEAICLAAAPAHDEASTIHPTRPSPDLDVTTAGAIDRALAAMDASHASGPDPDHLIEVGLGATLAGLPADRRLCLAVVTARRAAIADAERGRALLARELDHGPAPTNTRLAIAAASALAWLTHQAGDTPTALSLYAALERRADDHLGAFDSYTLGARRMRADLMGRLGDTGAAHQLSRALVEDLLDHHDLRTVEGILARMTYLRWAMTRGQSTEILNVAKDLVSDAKVLFGRHHVATTTVTRATANALGWAGAAEEARDLLADALQEVAPELADPATEEVVRLRLDLAHWVGTAGDPLKARRLLSSVAEDTSSRSLARVIVDRIARDHALWLARSLGVTDGRLAEALAEATTDIVEVERLAILLTAARKGDADALMQLPPEIASVVVATSNQPEV